MTDGRGAPLGFAVHAGQASDLAAAVPLLDAVRLAGRIGRPRTFPDALAADKGYSFAPIRRWCRHHRVTAVLPRRDDQRPVPGRRFDRARYRRRHVIECTVGHLKEAKRIAHRADKLALRYRVWLLLGSIRLLLRRYFSNTA